MPQSHVYYDKSSMSFLRGQLISRFHEGGGFQAVIRMVKNPELPFVGTAKLKLLLQGALSLQPRAENIIHGLRDGIRDLLKNSSEEMMKKENNDHLHQLFVLLTRLGDTKQTRLTYILKCLHCKSIVLKLSGWDLMQEAVDDAFTNRPYMRRYEVSGAGSTEVNGVYVIKEPVPESGDTPKYYLADADLSQPAFSIYRAKMTNSNEKWWFIALSDPSSRGFDRDIDFYQVSSPVGKESRDPPKYEWTVVGNKGKGQHPPPTVKPLEDYYLRPDETLDDYMIHVIKSWALQHDVLGSAFNESLHREIISRSVKLVCLLATLGALDKGTVLKIWQAAHSSQEEGITNEICTLVATIFQYLEVDMQMTLIEAVMRSLKDGDDIKVSILLEKMQSSGTLQPILNSTSNESLSNLMQLAWSLFEKESFTTLKSAGRIEKLLTACFGHNFGGKFIKIYISQCANDLSSATRPTSEVVRCLGFMVSKVAGNIPVLRELHEEKFPELLESDLIQYMNSNRSRCQDKTLDTLTYCQGIGSRLCIIRRLFGQTSDMKINKDSLLKLWSFSELSCEKEELFKFYGHILRRDDGLNFALDFDTLVDLYLDVFCNPDLSWIDCSELRFQTFKEYWTIVMNRVSVENREGNNDFSVDPNLDYHGLPTIWRIALTTKDKTVANKGLKLLMDVYRLVGNAEQSFLAYLFTKIGELEAESPQALSPDKASSLERCICILREAIVQSKPSMKVMHGYAGSEIEVRVTVRWKKTSPYKSYNAYPYNTYSHSGYGNGYNYDSVTEGEFQLNLTPYTSIFRLKHAVAAQLGISKPSSIDIEIDREDAELDSEVLGKYNLSTTTDIYAIYNFASSAVSNELSFEVTDDDDDDADVFSIFDIVVHDELYVDKLLALNDMLMYEYTSSSKVLWDVLMLLPSQEKYMFLTQQFAENGNPEFRQAFSVPQGTSTYLLQMVSIMLSVKAHENPRQAFRNNFVAHGGFSLVFDYFLECECKDSPLSHYGLKTSLEVMSSLFFYEKELTEKVVDGGKGCSVREIISKKSKEAVDKLLELAIFAANREDTHTVQQALEILTFLLQTPEASESLTKNSRVRALLSDVLLSTSDTVRRLASSFGLQCAKCQPAVFSWLVELFASLDHINSRCNDLVITMEEMMKTLDPCIIDQKELEKIARDVSKKLSANSTQQPSDDILVGCFKLSKLLVEINIDIVVSTEVGSNLIQFMLSNLLFTAKSSEKEVLKSFECNSERSRKAAFDLVYAYLSKSPQSLPVVVKELQDISEVFLSRMRNSWNHQISNELRNHDIAFSGLKNQGCTCYMNSLLQQLFMNVELREAVLRTPIKVSHRTLLWHKTDEELVGEKYSFQWKNGEYYKGVIKSFDPKRGHSIEYDHVSTMERSDPHFVRIRENGLHDMENGRVKPYEIDPDDDITEEELSAMHILEQLQRTFCFLKYSKRRYLDPRPFVEACKSLNLNFNVFQQNDAAEFCDKLLDRMETAMKGKHTGRNNWRDVLNVFGGKMLYQKIPKQCDAYETDKTECGHWQDGRTQDFLKIELIIRGKETIEDSLSELVRSELMDGENKISCDVCKEKKATTRATCFDTLPNSFILHLKRFDLDFETFETVKLNNRLEFPMKLNMYKFTKECREAEEQKVNAIDKRSNKGEELPSTPPRGGREYVRQDESPTQELAPQLETDTSDFEYELQGVLVHAGIAQGGHYYSFAKDSSYPFVDADGKDKWFRFDDDEVSFFDPSHIAEECFGGPQFTPTPSPTNSPMRGNSTEIDRTSNALMLFYKKSKKRLERTPSELERKLPSDGKDLVDGIQAFQSEVMDWNMQYDIKKHLLDPTLHDFVLSLLKPTPSLVSSFHSMKTLQFILLFFVGIVLRCRERSKVNTWLGEIDKAFANTSEFSLWFLESFIQVSHERDLYLEFFFQCTDSMARNSFGKLLFSAIKHNAPLETRVITSGADVKALDEYIHENNNQDIIYRLSLVKSVVDRVRGSLLFDVFKFSRTANELCVFIRELSGIPCLRKYMVNSNFIQLLVHVVVPSRADDKVEMYLNSMKTARSDLMSLSAIVIEAIAALVGVPQIARVPLLEDGVQGVGFKYERQLTKAGKEAFSTIFSEVTEGTGRMDMRLFLDFCSTTQANVHISEHTLISEFESVDKAKLGYWNVTQFLTYIAEGYLYNQSFAWKILSFYEFRNDLTPVSVESESAKATAQVTMVIPPESRNAVCDVLFWEVGIRSAESVTMDILRKVSAHDRDVAVTLISHCMHRVDKLIKDRVHSAHYDIYIRIALNVLQIDDLATDKGQSEELDGESLVNSKCCALMTDQYGIVNLYSRASELSASVHQYSYADNRYMHDIPLDVAYLDVAKQLYGSSHVVAAWLDANSKHSQELQLLLAKVNPTRRVIPPPDVINNLHKVKVRISGCTGDRAILNGVYSHCTPSNNGAGHGPQYRRVVLVEGQRVKFMCYRWEMKTHTTHAWFISNTPYHLDCGGKHDIDYFSVKSSFEGYGKLYTSDFVPPEKGTWVNRDDMKEAPEVTATWELSDDEEKEDVIDKDIFEAMKNAFHVTDVDINAPGIDTSFDDELCDLVESNLHANDLNLADVADVAIDDSMDIGSDVSGMSSGGEENVDPIVEIG